MLKVQRIDGTFPAPRGDSPELSRFAGVALAHASELIEPMYSKMRLLLESLEGIQFSQLERPDECCGFGGTFAINEEAVSCHMGLDRIADHQRAGTEVLTAPDMSCLMHLGGLLRRQGVNMHIMHIAQILAGRQVPNGQRS